MSVYREMRASRRLVMAGVVFGYGVAIAIFAFNLTSDDGTLLTSLAFLATFSLPPSVAVLSLDRRPSLLTLAAMAALVQGVILVTSIGLLQLVPAILWYEAGRRRPRPAVAPRGATWMRPLLAFATVVPLLAMTLHLDPVCRVVAEDGTLIREYEDEGAQSGWSFQLAGASSSSATSEGETTTCTSNTVVVWEAVVPILLSLAYIALIGRLWPTAEDLAKRPDADIAFADPGPQ